MPWGSTHALSAVTRPVAPDAALLIDSGVQILMARAQAGRMFGGEAESLVISSLNPGVHRLHDDLALLAVERL